MASNLKRLQDRAAAVAARMNELASVAERSEEQTAELRRLSDEADTVKTDLEFEGKLAAKEAELRAVVEKAAPAPAPAAASVEEPKKTEVRAIYPHHTSLRAFNDGPEAVEQAYRCGRWIRGVVFKSQDDLRWCRDHGVEARALNEGSNSAGGALVPEEFAARVIRLVETYGTFPGAAENVSMSRDTLVIPKRLTGTSAYFIGEGSAITESEPTYGNVSLTAKKLAVACRMSSEVVEDAVISLADACAQEFSTSLAYTVDTCGWIGDGTSTYGGIRGIATKINDGSYTASVVSAASGNTAFETLDKEDFLSVMAKCPRYALPGARWFISPAGYHAAMQRLDLAQGGWVGVAQGFGLTFLGYPVVLVHVMNSTLGTDAGKIKCLFGDLAMAGALGVRQGYALRVSQERLVEYDQTLVTGVVRATAVFHSLGSASEVGPVIALKTNT